MQARMEGANGCIKRHSRRSLFHASKPTRFWNDATKGFSIKKVYLWASPDTCGKLEAPHYHMQLAFFGTYKPVAIPFGSRVIAQLPREHRLVKNGFFFDWFIEGTYLCCNSDTHCIWMFSSTLQRKTKLQEFQVLSFSIPFQRHMSYAQHANNTERNV